MRRRQILSTITMTALIGILVLGAVWGWRSLFAPLEDGTSAAEEPAPTCTTERIGRGARLRSTQVRVSVFNASSRSGLAGRTLDGLLNRGFLAGEAGNAPSDLEVRRVEVWSTEENDPRARLVARQFGKKVRIRFSDDDLGPGVDVIVGDRFDELAKAPRSIRVRQPQEICVPIETVDPDV
jgi:hypothetical protein